MDLMTLVLSAALVGYLAFVSPWLGLRTYRRLGLTMLYLRTGSLVLPIVVHALVDIRSLLLIPGGRQDRIGSVATVEG
jgi:membrane protease YdiL (CAAX protease family)